MLDCARSPANAATRRGIGKVFLHAGDFVFGEPGTQVHAVPGSHVAICRRHLVLSVGRMCHLVPPSRPRCERGGVREVCALADIPRLIDGFDRPLDFRALLSQGR